MARKNDTASKDPLAALAEFTAKRSSAKAEYMAVLDQRGNALLSVNEKSGMRSLEYETLEEKLARDTSEYERIKTALRRPISMLQVRPALLVLIAIGLALLEAPANKFLFDVALQSSGIVSYAASAGTTAFLLILAHFGGRGLRQCWSGIRRRVMLGNIAVFVFCSLLALGIIAVLTVARAAFAADSGSIGDLLTSVRGHFDNLGPLGALVAAFSDTSALVLACINIGGIATTFLLAFFSHDADTDYDHVHRTVQRLEARLQKVHQSYLKARTRIIEDHAPHLVGYAANYNTANGKVIELKTLLGQTLTDDERFVLTELDQLAEDAEAADVAVGVRPSDGTVHDMRDYRRPVASEGA
jgi:hypothetical protein